MRKAVRTLYRNELSEIPEFGSRVPFLKDELPYTKLRLTFLVNGTKYFFWADNRNTNSLTGQQGIIADLLDVNEELVVDSFVNDEGWWERFMEYLSTQDLVKLEVTKRQVKKVSV